MIEAAKSKEDEKVFQVWEENWPAVEMFLRAGTQWNYGGMGSIVGLNYQSIDFLFRVLKPKNAKKLLDDIQTIEGAALRIFRKREEAKEKRG